MALAKNYFDLTEKYKSKYGKRTIVFMQVGAFFEVYGLKKDNKNLLNVKSEIYNFSKYCDLIVSEKNNKIDNRPVVMSGFRDYMIDKYLKKMQNQSYTIVVIKQDEQAKNTTRSLAGIFSPGTMFNDDDEDTKLSNNISCIWIRKNNNSIIRKDNLNIGICNIDIFTGKTNIFEFETENYKNPCSFDELEQFISIYNPIETNFLYNIETELTDTIIQYIGLNSKKIHKIDLNYIDESEIKTRQKEDENFSKGLKCENQVFQYEILKKYYKNDMVEQIKDNLSYYILSLQCLCYLLEFIHDHNPSLVDVLQLPELNNHDKRCILANHSLKQLNILSQTSENQYDKYRLENIINLCKTNMGKRKFRQILLNPKCNVKELNESYELIKHIYSKKYVNSWEKELMNIRDIERLKRKSILNKITPYDFYTLYENLQQIKKIINVIIKDKKLSKKLNSEKNKINCNKLIEFLEKYFIIKECKQINTTYFDKNIQQNDFKNFIKRGNYDEYDNCLRKKSDYRCGLNEIVKYLSQKSIEYDSKVKSPQTYIKIHTTATQGISLLITKKRSTILKKAVQKMKEHGDSIRIDFYSVYDNETKEIELDTNIDVTNHISKNMMITSTKINNIIFQISKVEEQFTIILQNVYQKIQKEFNLMEDMFYELNVFVMEVDVLYSKVKMIDVFHLSCPVIKEKDVSYVNIKKLRHLIIESMNNDELYVSNDIKINNSENDAMGILLFGTNAVGKTSFIKSLGIAVIMAQAGMYVPCESMEYHPYEYIFTRILGNDNIFKGLSTFAVEMSELRIILNKSNKNSLILGDELCSGTENESAMSIFMSSLEELYTRSSSFIFATHFHEIVQYEELEKMPRLHCKHMRVKYNNELKTLVFDRKLCDGSGEPIYGLEVCKSLRMPDVFLNRAYELRNKYSSDREKNVLNMKLTKYNSDKLRGMCEFCKKNVGTEIHHLQYQCKANKKDNYITNDEHIFHKDHKANLSSICESCHNKLHEMNLVYTKKKTTDGYMLTLKRDD